ncbi:MAG: cyclomaltodextrinase N-terminal domain-containing protein, partial [Ferruginibacter sp.]
MKKNFFFTILFFGFLLASSAQNINVYPTNWWTGMKWNKVQLLLHGSSADFNKQTVTVKYPGIKLNKINRLENGRYLALDITISSAAKPGVVDIIFKDGSKTNTIKWPLNKRRDGRGTAFAQGVRSSDLIYLLMPDRFSNGDEGNDKVAGMRDQSLSRDSIYARHGGDLQGVMNHLDYLKDLGVTTVWMTPVLENDMPDRTEHG